MTSKEQSKAVAQHKKHAATAKASPVKAQPLKARNKSRQVIVAKAATSHVVLRKVAPEAVVPAEVSLTDIKSNAVMVQHADTGDVIFAKNASTPVPIASLTKLMTAVVLLDSKLAMDMPLTVEADDVDNLRHSTSHLPVGVTATRQDLLRLALMASENRAAAALARTYPGGTPAFVARMNRKAQSLGMTHTHYEDSSGLGNGNFSTAEDLAKLVAAASSYPLIREFSTTDTYLFNPLAGGRPRQFGNTNPLVKNGQWDIDVSKTGFTNEAGKCLVMKARIANEPVVIVLLDSTGKMTRVGDAQRVRKWLENHPANLHRAAIAQANHPRPTT
nr:serine hydrolase [Leeia oryzae]